MSTTVTRLFESFHPSEYNLMLDLDKAAMTFTGSVTIVGKKVGRPSKRLTFHQKDLKILTATITKHDKNGDQIITVSRINTQDSFDELRLHTDTVLYPGDYTVSLQYQGVITKPMNGIYPCLFEHDGQQKMLIATQFESHHAREAFPCVDEPEAKAVFKLSLTTPKDDTVLANTPILTQQANADRVVTTFEPTPKMSTYLLAFAFGELGCTESKTAGGVVVRCYATPDNVSQTTHSLEVAVKALDFFGDYFGTPYPLPKLDMVALPDFSAGAMENWGLITYREVAMLIDEAHSSIENRQYVATVVTHELSHQWFGNLVTMKWWDDLWLNESFANMMEYRAVDSLYPEWHIWEQFVSGEGVGAKRRDSLIDVQPVHCEVNHPDEISTLFDPSIVYAKGGTLLYMLMNHIGEQTFRVGLKAYFAAHRYGNTQAEDLWAALSAASGQDISSFMSDWLNRPGYPVINVDYSAGADSVALTQSRFLSDPTAKNSIKDPWQVPLATTWELNETTLKEASANFTIKKQTNQPFLFNHDGVSYFLPNYTNPEHQESIVNAIKSGSVDPLDRLLTVDNLNLLQRGGLAETVDLAKLFPAYATETNENVWGSLSLAVSEIRKLTEAYEDKEDILNGIVQLMVGPSSTEIGWDDRTDDSAQTLRLRSLIFSIAAGSKTPAVIDEGLKRFKAMKKPSDIAASIRSIVLFIGARHGTDEDFERLLKLHNTSTSADEKEELSSALCSTKNEKQFTKLISMLTGDLIRRQDLMHWYVWLLRNRYSRQATWTWLSEQWSWIEAEFTSDKSYGSFARYAGSIFSRKDDLAKFSEFFDPKKDVIALKRTILLAEQEINSRIVWREKNESAMMQWLDDQVKI